MEASRCSSASHTTPLVVVAVVRLSACAPLAAAASGADGGPIPRTSVDGRLTWAGGSDLAGFEVAFEPTGAGAADGGDATGVDTPGFGPAVAVVALVLGIGWLVRRRRGRRGPARIPARRSRKILVTLPGYVVVR